MKVTYTLQLEKFLQTKLYFVSNIRGHFYEEVIDGCEGDQNPNYI